MLVRSILFLAVLLHATLAAAHPGHGVTAGTGLAHWVEPAHIAPLGIALAIAGVWLSVRTRARRRA